MFGGSYIVQIGEETYKAATQGLYGLICWNLLETEHEGFAGELAAAVALFIWDDPPTDKRHIAFRQEHQKRIESELWKPYLRTPAMQELLSGAAYNIGYGRYVAAGNTPTFAYCCGHWSGSRISKCNPVGAKTRDRDKLPQKLQAGCAGDADVRSGLRRSLPAHCGGIPISDHTLCRQSRDLSMRSRRKRHHILQYERESAE